MRLPDNVGVEQHGETFKTEFFYRSERNGYNDEEKLHIRTDRSFNLVYTGIRVKKMLFDIPNLEALFVSSCFAVLFLLIFNIKNGTIKAIKTYKLKDYVKMGGLGFLGFSVFSSVLLYSRWKMVKLQLEILLWGCRAASLPPCVMGCFLY